MLRSKEMTLKFSITQMLYGMVVAAFVAAIVGAGANGSPLAYGIGVSVCMLFIYFGFFGALYWGTFLISGGRKRRPTTAHASLEHDQPPGESIS